MLSGGCGLLFAADVECDKDCTREVCVLFMLKVFVGCSMGMMGKQKDLMNQPVAGGRWITSTMGVALLLNKLLVK